MSQISQTSQKAVEKMIIVIAPSGGGKSTFLKRLLQDCPQVKAIANYTTRAKRPGEIDGKSYCFVDRERFSQLRDEGFFVEWAEVHGRLYGTPLDQIKKIWSESNHVVMDVDIQGADTLKSKFPQAFTLFILPPSVDELRRRVEAREDVEPVELDLRMATAEKEIARAADYDARVVNEDLEVGYAEFKKMIEEYLKSP